MPPTNLAPPPTTFIGREAALRSLADALSRARLVTVLGPPGTGKTRLVKEHALSLLASGDAPPGGVFFCDLSEATTATGVLARIAQALGVDPGQSPPEDEARRRIGDALRVRPPTLVLLDNYEQLVRCAASVVGDLLRAAPAETRFLVTSRERLGLPGESLFDLGPLSLPDDPGRHDAEAVLLFVERARAASHSFQPSEASLRTIAKLCHLLDGLPLAIELAAARVRILAPAELVERFESRFGWLTRDPSTPRPRRATLREAIEASWALLAPWEQDTLSQIAVFRGGLTVSRAERVVDLRRYDRAPSILDILQSLRDKSLLLAGEGDGNERRLTLLRSIRDFGEAKLDAAELSSAHARHARACLELGEELAARLDAHDDPEVRRSLRAEHDNLLAVHERFLEGETPDDLRGASLRAALVLARTASTYPYSFLLDTLGAALARTRREDVGPALFARGLEARGNIRRFVGQARESVLDFEEMLEIAEQEGDLRLQASGLSGLGNAATVGARWADAGRLFERGLALASRARDARTEGRLLAMLAATHYNRDDPARARELLLRSLELLRETRDRGHEGVSVTSLGIVSLALGDLPAARTHLAEGLDIHRQVSARHWEGVTLSYMAIAEHDAGRLEQAHELHERALALLSEMNVRRALGLALAASACALLSAGRLDEARERLRRSIDVARVMSPDHEGLFMGWLGAADALAGDIPAALDRLEYAERSLGPHERPAFVAAVAVLRGLADVARSGSAREPEKSLLLGAARDRLAAAAPWEALSFEARFAATLLRSALGAAGEGDPAGAQRHALVVGPDGLWFRPPRVKSSVRLHRRRALQRILHSLAEHRLKAPGEALSIPRLVERGWPGERVLPEAGTERVYTAIATLRKLGLRRLLLQRDDGYLLDPEVGLSRPASPA